MKYLAVPAGASVRFTACARSGLSLHRWDVAVLPVEGGVSRMNFSSQIGREDLDQRIEIPAQAMACELEIQCRHETGQGWSADLATIEHEATEQLVLGFCDPDQSGAQANDVVLSFAVGALANSER